MADETNDDAFGEFKGGWSALQDIGDGSANLSPEQRAIFEERQLREYELNRSIHAALSTPEGQTLLEFMREIATEGARFDIANEVDPARAAAIGFFREGQAAFYFELTKRMRKAMEGPPTAQRD